jgi:hypothetical protein
VLKVLPPLAHRIHPKRTRTSACCAAVGFVADGGTSFFCRLSIGADDKTSFSLSFFRLFSEADTSAAASPLLLNEPSISGRLGRDSPKMLSVAWPKDKSPSPVESSRRGMGLTGGASIDSFVRAEDAVEALGLPIDAFEQEEEKVDEEEEAAMLLRLTLPKGVRLAAGWTALTGPIPIVFEALLMSGRLDKTFAPDDGVPKPRALVGGAFSTSISRLKNKQFLKIQIRGLNGVFCQDGHLAFSPLTL